MCAKIPHLDLVGLTVFLLLNLLTYCLLPLLPLSWVSFTAKIQHLFKSSNLPFQASVWFVFMAPLQTSLLGLHTGENIQDMEQTRKETNYRGFQFHWSLVHPTRRHWKLATFMHHLLAYFLLVVPYGGTIHILLAQELWLQGVESHAFVHLPFVSKCCLVFSISIPVQHACRL